MFVDRAVILVRSGHGGAGCVSFRREKFVPRGGPDGGNGGRGGDVIIRAVAGLSTLLDVARRSVHQAESGRPGMGAKRFGRSGRDLTIEVPSGTIVRDLDGGRILAELLAPADHVIVARGGAGGRGNRQFATATNRAPRHAEDGGPGEEKRLELELRLLADLGLVGLPNAGKSTLLRRVSAAKPKVASYPFTTLAPHLGVAGIGDYDTLVIADIPGLIEGAHAGVGLGADFLRHVERTRVILHIVAWEGGGVPDLAEAYRIIEGELSDHSPALVSKPRIVVLNKVDLIDPGERSRVVEAFASEVGRPVHGISALTGEGVDQVLEEAYVLVRGGDRKEPGGGDSGSNP